MNNIHAPLSTLELVSALTDGQLGGEDFLQALTVCQHDPAALASWRDYHLIGDVLRSSSLAASGSEAAFLRRLQSRLAAEPALAAARLPDVPQPQPAPATGVLPGYRAEPANDSSYRWKLLAGAASFAAVAAIAWNAGTALSPASGPQLAQAIPPAQVLVASPQGTMVRDARLEELLVAHKQFGGTSALQMPSGFLRNATFDSQPSAAR